MNLCYKTSTTFQRWLATGERAGQLWLSAFKLYRMQIDCLEVQTESVRSELGTPQVLLIGKALKKGFRLALGPPTGILHPKIGKSTASP